MSSDGIVCAMVPQRGAADVFTAGAPAVSRDLCNRTLRFLGSLMDNSLLITKIEGNSAWLLGSAQNVIKQNNLENY